MRLEIWTLYDSPIDFQGLFVARKWLEDKPTQELLKDNTLEGLRKQLPQGLVRMARHPEDDPKIIETWL